MSVSITVTNTTDEHIAISGIVFSPNASRNISDPGKIDGLANNDVLFEKLADGSIVISDQSGDLEPVAAWNILNGTEIKSTIAQSSYATGNKVWTHNSPRPEKDGRTIYVYWTGAGETTNELGSGDLLIMEPNATTPVATKKLEFYHGLNDMDPIYVQQAQLMWTGAGVGDYVTAKCIASRAIMQTAANLDYTLTDDGRVVYAGTGAGTHGFAQTPCPVRNHDHDGYWNLSETMDLTPAPAGDGNADIYFDREAVYAIFMNKIPVYGDSHGYETFDNWDCIRLRKGYTIELSAHSESGNDWKLFAYVTMFRERAS